MSMIMVTAAGRAIPDFPLQDRLRRAREFAQMDQMVLAAAMGISRTSVGNYENGRRVPSKPYLRAWAEVTGVDLEWLETGMAPAASDGSQVVRPKGFEPLTFWSVVSGWHDSAIPDTVPAEWASAAGYANDAFYQRHTGV